MNVETEERREDIAHSLTVVRARIAEAALSVGRQATDISLIAVTKTYPLTDIQILHDLGVRDFAENRESDGATKSVEFRNAVSRDSRWHYQGQIQGNKLKSLVTWANAIHSLDNFRHLELLTRYLPQGKQIDLFLQVSLDGVAERGGASVSDLHELARQVLQCPGLNLMGIMAVAPRDEIPENAFSRLALIHSDFKAEFPSSPYLSAGMSGDFEAAIRHGATHVRIGSSILGSRGLKR